MKEISLMCPVCLKPSGVVLKDVPKWPPLDLNRMNTAGMVFTGIRKKHVLCDCQKIMKKQLKKKT